MLVGAERDLLAVVRRPDPRALHPDAPPAERDLTRFVAATDRDAVRVVLALRADDLVDLRLHQLLQHAQPDADAQREQPVLRGLHELPKRGLHARREHQLPGSYLLAARSVLRTRYGLHGGSSRLDGLVSQLATVAARPDEA
jgi:hypothetical protein